jgi:hypothetical protein
MHFRRQRSADGAQCSSDCRRCLCSTARVPLIGALVSFAGFDLFLGLFDHMLDHLDCVGVVHNSKRPPVTCDLLPKIWSFLFHPFLATKGLGESAESSLSSILFESIEHGIRDSAGTSCSQLITPICGNAGDGWLPVGASLSEPSFCRRGIIWPRPQPVFPCTQIADDTSTSSAVCARRGAHLRTEGSSMPIRSGIGAPRERAARSEKRKSRQAQRRLFR